MRVTISCSALIQLPLSDTIIWKNIRALWRISSQMVCLGGQIERDPLILAEAKVDIITYVNFLCTNIFQCLNIYKNQEEVFVYFDVSSAETDELEFLISFHVTWTIFGVLENICYNRQAIYLFTIWVWIKYVLQLGV